MKLCTVDLETTGLVLKGLTYEKDYMDFPYILGMAWKINDQPRYEFIINQEGRKVPESATAINGISQAMCDASSFNTFTVLLQFMMDADQSNHIIGHNLYFDTSIIKANVLRIIKVGGITPMMMFEKISDIIHKDKRIDTMRLCAKHFGGKWPSLDEAYFKLFNKKREKSHSAGVDVDDTWMIYEELVRIGVIIHPKNETILGVVGDELVLEEEV